MYYISICWAQCNWGEEEKGKNKRLKPFSDSETLQSSEKGQKWLLKYSPFHPPMKKVYARNYITFLLAGQNI